MNKDNALQMLLQFLECYIFFPDLKDELVEMVSGTGFELKFFTLLATRLRYLQECGIDAVQAREFEPLGGAGGLYSMHLTGKGYNIRILYAFLPNQEPALLHAFYEREGKNKTDYSKKIPLAQKRLKIMKERYDNERFRI